MALYSPYLHPLCPCCPVKSFSEFAGRLARKSSFWMLILAKPSDIWGGTISEPSGDILSVNDSSLSGLRSSFVAISMVLDVSPAAKDTVVLIAV